MGNAMFTWKCNAHNLVLPQRVSCPACANVARQRLHAQGLAVREHLFSQELKVPTCVSALDPCDKRWVLPVDTKSVEKPIENTKDITKPVYAFRFAKKFVHLWRFEDCNNPRVMDMLRWLDAGAVNDSLYLLYRVATGKDAGPETIACTCLNLYSETNTFTLRDRVRIQELFGYFWKQGQAIVPGIIKSEAKPYSMLDEAQSLLQETKQAFSRTDLAVVDDLYHYLHHSSHPAYMAHVVFEKRVASMEDPTLEGILDWASVLINSVVNLFKKDFGASSASYTMAFRKAVALRVVLDYLEGHRRGG